MGMEPFVAADDNAFGHLIGSIPNLVANLQQAQAFKVGLDEHRAGIAEREAQAQQAQVEAANKAQQLSRAQMFQQDVAAVGANPNAQAISALVTKYPEFADHLKTGWDIKDKAAKDADLTQLGEVYSAAASGNWDLATKQAQARIDADKAAGNVDASDQAMLAQLQAAAGGDEGAKKQVLTALGTHIAAISGPEHFASVYGALKGGYTLEAGATRYDENGDVVAQSPFIKTADGGILERDGHGGTAGGAPAPVSTEPGGDGGFENAVAFTLKHEGGYNPHDMNGAPVNFGINQGANPGVDVKSLTQDEAKGIYKTKYWDQSGAANLSAAMQTPYFDTYIINPSRAQQFLKASGGDPNKFMQLREAWMGSVAAKNPQYAKAYANRNADLRMLVHSQTDTAAPSQDGAPPGYHVLVPGKPKDAPAGYRWNALGDLEAIPGGPADKNGTDDTLPGNPNLMGPAYLATVPPNLATQVRALAEGRLPMPSSFALAKPYWQKLLQMTAQYDPSFDASAYPARKQAITQFTGMGKGAQVVSSVNRVANHLNTLWDTSHKLAGPETGWSVTNSLLAKAGQSFEPADAKAYDTAVGFVAGELEKIARNSPGTEAGVDRVIKNLARTNSAKTREEAIRTAVDIIAGAVDPLKEQYNSAFTNDSTRPKIPWVTPQAQKVYQRIGGTSGTPDLSLTGAGADTNSATDLPPGARVVGTYKGRRVIEVNGKRMVEQ